MALPQEEMQEYIDGWRRRARKRREEEARLRVDLMERAKEAARVLVEDFGARRVVLFGSLAWGTRLDHLSDVDLAVEGLPGERYWKALVAVDDIVGRSVDLVPLDKAVPSLRERIEKDGVRLA